MRRRSLGVLAVLATLVAPAAADPTAADRAEATRLFEQGRTLLKDEKFAEACSAFKQSFALDPAPGTQVNLGDCALRDGQVSKAWRLYDAAARDYDKSNRAAGAKFARDAAAALTSRLTTVVVRVDEPDVSGLAVHVADVDVPSKSEVVVLVDPGKIEVTARAPGHPPFAVSIEGVAGKRVTVRIPGWDSTTSERPEPSPAGRRAPGRVKAAIWVGVGGGALLAGSIVLGLVARSTYNDVLADANGCFETMQGLFCKTTEAQDRVNGAILNANIATGLAIAGGVAVAAGAIVYLTAPREYVALAVVPAATATSVGFGIVGRF
jgi:hypothetical protein